MGLLSSIFGRRGSSSGTSACMPPGQLLPQTAVKLCRLCLDISDPSFEFYDPDPKLGKPSFIVSNTVNFTEAQSQGFSSSLILQGTPLATASKGGSRLLSMKVASSGSTVTRLQNSTEYFAMLCQESPDVRRWLETAVMLKRTVYMVVGINTLVDAAVTVEQSRRLRLQGRATIPVSQIAMGGLEMGGGIPGVGAEMSLDRTVDVTSSFTAPGEQVYAIQYRKVIFPRHRLARRSEDPMLKKGYDWRRY